MDSNFTIEMSYDQCVLACNRYLAQRKTSIKLRKLELIEQIKSTKLPWWKRIFTNKVYVATSTKEAIRYAKTTKGYFGISQWDMVYHRGSKWAEAVTDLLISVVQTKQATVQLSDEMAFLTTYLKD